MTNSATAYRSRRIDFLARHPAGDVIIGRVIGVRPEKLTFECEGTFWPVWKDEVSWLYQFDIEDLVTPGDKQEILVTSSVPEANSGHFSLRRLKPNPYVEIFRMLTPGDQIVGEIVDVSVRKGLHLRWGGGRVIVPREELNPCETYGIGEYLAVIAQEANPTLKKAKASRLALFPNFYANLVEGFQLGDVVEGTVVGIVEFGLFINLRPCLNGLAHVSSSGLTTMEASPDVKPRAVQTMVKAFPLGSRVLVRLNSIEASFRVARIGVTILRFADPLKKSITEKCLEKLFHAVV